MPSFYEISGNNLPELTSTSSPREYIHYFRHIIMRKKNTYSDPEQIAVGYNRAISELVDELDRLEYKMDAIELDASNKEAIQEANRLFKLHVLAAAE